MSHKTIKHSAYISLGFLVFISFINHLINWIAWSKSKSLASNASTFSWKHGNIHYLTKGKGTPVLLIHDLTLGSSSFEFHKNIDTLSRYHKVYAIDLIGYGKSDHPPIVYTGYLMIQLITDFICEIIKAPCAIVASNQSSQYAIAVASISPNWISKLIFIGSIRVSKYKVGLIDKLKFKVFRLPIIGDSLFNLIASKRKLKQQLQSNLDSPEYLFTDYILEHYYVSAHLGKKNSKYLAASLHSHHLNISTSHLLATIHHKIFFLVGENDTYANKTENNLKQYPLDYTVEFLKDCHSYPHLERSDLSNELTLEFLRK